LADAADLKSHPELSDASTLIDAFVNSRRDGLSNRTLDNYRLYLSRSSDVVGLNVTGIDVQRFITSRKCTNGGKHAYFRCLRAFYRWLYSAKSGLKLDSQNNPILAVEAPKVEKKILPSLTNDQVELLIDRAKCTRDKAIISLLADSGLRLIELANIEPKNIDWKNRLIKVRCKGNKEGYAPFGAQTEKLLREWLKEYKANGRLWNLNHNAIYDMLRKLRTYTGLPCNPHTFRRTFASILAKRGVDSLHIMRLGRWESIAMVERYTRSVKFEDSLKLYNAIVA
jgi:site-specific recombinase XerD